MSNHEAGFSKLGYLYQVRYALFRAIEDTDAYFIKLESLDDIQLDKLSGSELFQLKHHYYESFLSDMSVDFWKTIGIWSELINKESLDIERTKFYLVTTSNVKDGTIASKLLNEMRDVSTAIQLMDAAAMKIENKKLESSISQYNNLSEQQKAALCQAIVVLPSENNTQSIIDKIKRRLELTVKIDFVDILYERLEGWWFGKVVGQLFGNEEKIWREEVRNKVISLSYDFHPDSLPIDFNNLHMEQHEIEFFLDHQFVKQLKLIEVGTQRITYAILDYYRAFNQRFKWISDDLLIEYDLSEYEKRLIDDWERFRLSIIDELGNAGEDELKKAGRQIFNWVQTQADIRIKPKVSDRFVMVGTYHMLTDKTPVILGWHPNFEDRLKQLAEGVL